MKVQVMEEAGYEHSLLGLSLSFYDHAIPLDEFWTEDKKQRADHRACKLAFKGGGHNKFLESIQVWIYVQAARSFWSEFDTYRVGMTKQSSSTMHTLDKRSVTEHDFEFGTNKKSIDAFNDSLSAYKDENNGSGCYKGITLLKNDLPEGWLQERMICTNYMVLQNIVKQRTGHRLKYWDIFIGSLVDQLQHPEFILTTKEG